MKNQIMVDMETLGTRADAIVLSVGLVKFDLNDHMGEFGDTFYTVISIDDQAAQGRYRCPKTEKWWEGQKPDARKVLETTDRTPLAQALEEIYDFFGFEEYCVWGNGADFDNAMLQHLFTTNGYEPPWKFWDNRCFRTYKAMFGNLTFKPVNMGVAHHALDDAKFQARHCQIIHQKLKEIGAVK